MSNAQSLPRQNFTDVSGIRPSVPTAPTDLKVLNLCIPVKKADTPRFVPPKPCQRTAADSEKAPRPLILKTCHWSLRHGPVGVARLSVTLSQHPSRVPADYLNHCQTSTRPGARVMETTCRPICPGWDPQHLDFFYLCCTSVQRLGDESEVGCAPSKFAKSCSELTRNSIATESTCTKLRSPEPSPPSDSRNSSHFAGYM